MIDYRAILLANFPQYFGEDNVRDFSGLPIVVSDSAWTSEGCRVAIPEWASEAGVGKPAELVVPGCCIREGFEAHWENVDWWRAAFSLLTCEAERRFESTNGPIHSYSFKLPAAMESFWERAWVNRIFLFLRAWVARQDPDIASRLPPRPRAAVYLTHDVDYVSKTLALRAKQSAFVLFNMLRLAKERKFSPLGSLLGRLLRFGLGSGDYWQFARIRELEENLGAASVWNFYGGPGGYRRSPSELLLDPSYRVTDARLADQIRTLAGNGHRIGLHQGFHSWRDSARMLREKQRLEEAAGAPVFGCRQHWLRFSFDETWKAQEAAGFRCDTTLGFNDRPAFRNSAALMMPVWIAGEARLSDSLRSLPLVLMDSHLYDYQLLDADARRSKIDYYLDEIEIVGGEATIVWHQRVFHPDYGWGEDYQYLLDGLAARGIAAELPPGL